MLGVCACGAPRMHDTALALLPDFSKGRSAHADSHSNSSHFSSIHREDFYFAVFTRKSSPPSPCQTGVGWKLAFACPCPLSALGLADYRTGLLTTHTPTLPTHSQRIGFAPHRGAADCRQAAHSSRVRQRQPNAEEVADGHDGLCPALHCSQAESGGVS